MIILHNYQGTEPATPISVPNDSSFIAFYTLNELDTLMTRPHPTGRDFAGIRFHFNTSDNGAEQPEELAAIGVTIGNDLSPPEEILSPQGNDYMRSDGNGAHSVIDFQPKLAAMQTAKLTMINFNPNRDACVYFSRHALNHMLEESEEPLSGIALHLCDFTTAFDANGDMIMLKSLILCGVDQDGNHASVGYRSDLPCPPHCGTNYPTGGGSPDDD
ncbi:MAG: hypothetical protein AAGG75_07265 [Bacteroidota bacterium]